MTFPNKHCNTENEEDQKERRNGQTKNEKKNHRKKHAISQKLLKDKEKKELSCIFLDSFLPVLTFLFIKSWNSGILNIKHQFIYLYILSWWL